MQRNPRSGRPVSTVAASVALSLIALLGCSSGQAAASAPTVDPFAPGRVVERAGDEAEPRREGRVVEAPRNIASFSPDAAEFEVNAELVDLRQILDDLGPVARLWYQHVMTLSNPFFEGRAPESRGSALAGEYIEFWFRQYGLEPAFPIQGSGDEDLGGGAAEAAWISHQQPFTFNHRVFGRNMQVVVNEARAAVNDRELVSDDEYVFLGVSGSGSVTAPVTFVGYGLAEGEDGYSSFDDETDLTGRIALLLRYEPLDEDGRSKWGGRRYSSHAAIAGKLRSVQDRGAAGIILVNPPGARQGASGLERLSRSAQFGRALNIPAIQMTQEAADDLLRAADPHRRDLMTWRRLADEAKVTTVDFSDRVRVTISGIVHRTGPREAVQARNIGAVLRGRGKFADEWIVIGAHYDHVGYGDFGTSPQYRGMLHPGADDNASGTAGVLILAKTISEHYANTADEEHLRSILFIAFDAEESGLHGSRFFVNNPTMPAERISVMINMDMIGRLRGGNLSVMGVSTAEGLEDILRPHFEESGLTVATSPGSSGRSDDANFINIQVPAMHFFTGMHREYHAPMDQGYTVNPAGARDVLRLIHHITLDLASQPEQLEFTQPRRTRTEDRGYAPVRLGIRPGMGQEIERGVYVEAVTPETAADRAGMKSGDILIAWAGEPIESIGTMVEKLRNHRPGDTVVITVLRDDEEVDLEVHFPADADGDSDD